VPALTSAAIEFAFLIGSSLGPAEIVEVLIDKGRYLARTDMLVSFEPVEVDGDTSGGGGKEPDCRPACLTLLDEARVVISLANGTEVGRLDAPAGLKWCPANPCGTIELPKAGDARSDAVAASATATRDPDFGGEHGPSGWELEQPRGSVRLPLSEGQLFKASLSFTTPTNLKPGSRHLVRIYQRRGKVLTGGVFLELVVDGQGAKAELAPSGEPTRRRTRRKTQS